MTWCNNPDEDDEHHHLHHRQDRLIQLITSQQEQGRTLISDEKTEEIPTIVCPSCGHNIHYQDQAGINDLPGLPAGVKFDPTDHEILEHLEAKVLSDMKKIHPLIHEFIPIIEGENGICYTHPEKLPGVNKDGQIRHFFHRPSKAYTTGTRKRRKVHTDEEGNETRWHKTGKTRPVFNVNGGGSSSLIVKGFKKILVLYTNYGRQRKPEKTNWVMHQYHLGNNEDEKDGELVVSKVFYQTQPRQCGTNNNNNNVGNLIISDQSSRLDLDHRKSKKSRTINGYDDVDEDQRYINYPFISNYNDGNKESSPHNQVVHTLVVQGGEESSFIHQLACNTSKGRIVKK